VGFNPEFDSNEMDESSSHLRKHNEQRISTLLGITIDSSDENANANANGNGNGSAFDSIRSNRECDSNEMDESDLQW
jgi:hypothetical protein